MQKYGGFASKVRSFYAKKSDVFVLPKPTSLPPKKSFLKISYISYTHASNYLYLQTISGVGLGVGFGGRCRIFLFFMHFHGIFLTFSIREMQNT